jgi:hypothetical protein
MNTIFPEAIKIKVKIIGTGMPVPNIAVFIHLFAIRKNDYYFLLPITNENGEIEITKDWLKNEINKEVNLFLMDYSSSLEMCLPKIELTVLSQEQISRAIKAMSLYKNALKTPQENIDRLSYLDNPKFETISKVFDLQGEKILMAELNIKAIIHWESA